MGLSANIILPVSGHFSLVDEIKYPVSVRLNSERQGWCYIELDPM